MLLNIYLLVLRNFLTLFLHLLHRMQSWCIRTRSSSMDASERRVVFIISDVLLISVKSNFDIKYLLYFWQLLICSNQTAPHPFSHWQNPEFHLNFPPTSLKVTIKQKRNLESFVCSVDFELAPTLQSAKCRSSPSLLLLILILIIIMYCFKISLTFNIQQYGKRIQRNDFKF